MSHKLARAVNSVLTQTYQNWELVVVNDAGPTPQLPDDPRITVLEQPRLNKSYARNLGTEHSKNDWMCWLDDDDGYMPTYLEIINQSINEYPEYQLFNFGGIIFRAKGSRDNQLFSDTILREPFEHEDHVVFKSGKIATGHFVFHRNAMNEVGMIPKETNPYLFADAMKKKYPELKEFYGPLYMEGGKELGNPWGDDFSMYYMLTRKYKHKTLPFHLYVQYARV